LHILNKGSSKVSVNSHKIESEKTDLSIVSAAISNLFMPGSGSWRLGYKKRGAAILMLMLFCTIMGGLNYASSINSQLDAVMDTQSDAAFDASFDNAGSNNWMIGSFLIFLYSFVDIYLIHKARSN
jgi:hypothetical protein